MTRKIPRRDFLKLMGAGAIVLGFGGLGGFAGLFRKQKSYGSGQPIMNYVDLVSNLATSGKWEIIQHSVNGVLKDNICPVMPVHAALLRNGHVLFLAGSQNDRQGYNHHCQIFRNFIWDFDNGYQNSTFRVMATPTDVFCAGHSFLSDGSLLIAGGTKELSASTGQPGGLGFQGTPDSYLFEPLSESFPRGVPSSAKWVHLTPRPPRLQGHIPTAGNVTTDRVPTSPGDIPPDA